MRLWLCDDDGDEDDDGDIYFIRATRLKKKI